MLVKIFVLALISVVFAQDEEFRGTCPFDKVRVKTALDANLYKGHWYDIKRYYAQGNPSCTDTNYEWIQDEGAFNAVVSDKLETTYRSYVPKVKKTTEAGKFEWSFNNTNRPYWVLDTDYTDYAVVWSCVNYLEQGTNKQGLWVLRRSRDSTVNSAGIENLFNDYKDVFHKDMLRDVSHTTCGAYLPLPGIIAVIAIFLSKLL